MLEAPWVDKAVRRSCRDHFRDFSRLDQTQSRLADFGMAAPRALRGSSAAVKPSPSKQQRSRRQQNQCLDKDAAMPPGQRPNTRPADAELFGDLAPLLLAHDHGAIDADKPPSLLDG
jgi:hypothetical protein